MTAQPNTLPADLLRWADDLARVSADDDGLRKLVEEAIPVGTDAQRAHLAQANYFLWEAIQLRQKAGALLRLVGKSMK
jgi:hypothetical protein